MKKKILALALGLAMLSGMSMTAGAATPTVQVTGEGDLKVDQVELTGFSGMAPGETRSQTIAIKNNSDETMNFYVSEETLQNLESTNNSAGGAYEFDMKVGDTTDDATSLLTQVAGGYTALEASKEGLSEIDGLSGDEGIFLVQLESGASTNLYLTLTIYGEGNDSDYANAAGALQFAFGAEAPKVNTEPTVIERLHTIIVNNPVYKYVQTGDHAAYLLYFTVFAVGLICVIVGYKKKNKKKEA